MSEKRVSERERHTQKVRETERQREKRVREKRVRERRE